MSDYSSLALTGIRPRALSTQNPDVCLFALSVLVSYSRPINSALSISLSPSLSSTASLEAHIIPKLAIGVNGLGNKADIFVDLDSKATAKATIKASAKAVINAREEQEDTRSLAVRQTVTKTPANTADTSIDGCVDISAGLSVNVGAEASFLGLFDKENKLEFPVKNFSLFKVNSYPLVIRHV